MRTFKHKVPVEDWEELGKVGENDSCIQCSCCGFHFSTYRTGELTVDEQGVVLPRFEGEFHKKDEWVFNNFKSKKKRLYSLQISS